MKVHYPKLYNMAHLSLNVLLLPKDLTIIFYYIITSVWHVNRPRMIKVVAA